MRLENVTCTSFEANPIKFISEKMSDEEKKQAEYHNAEFRATETTQDKIALQGTMKFQVSSQKSKEAKDQIVNAIKYFTGYQMCLSKITNIPAAQKSKFVHTKLKSESDNPKNVENCLILCVDVTLFAKGHFSLGNRKFPISVTKDGVQCYTSTL